MSDLLPCPFCASDRAAAPQPADSAPAQGSATAKRAERTAPVLIATHNIGEGLPSGDAAGAGAVLAADLAQRAIGYVSAKTLRELCEPEGSGPIVACAGFDTVIPLYAVPNDAQGSTRDFDNAHIDDQFYVDFSRNRDGSPKSAPAQTAIEQARRSILAASIGSCDCNTKSPEATYHAAHCRYLKLLSALDSLDGITDDVPQAAPVAWRYRHGANRWEYSAEKPDGPSIHLFEVQPLYADVPQTVEVTDEMLAISGLNKDWAKLYEALEDIVAHAESGEWTLPTSFAARARTALSRPALPLVPTPALREAAAYYLGDSIDISEMWRAMVAALSRPEREQP